MAQKNVFVPPFYSTQESFPIIIHNGNNRFVHQAQVQDHFS